MIVDEVYIIRTVDKFRTLQDVNQEADIGLDTADTEFLKDAEHLLNGFGMIEAVRRRLNQERIIVRRNNRACISVAAVETDAEAAAAAVYRDFAGIRHEVIQRIFCRNTALDGIAETVDSILRLNADFIAVEGIAFSDFDLSLDDVDTRNHFGDRVFYLDTGVNFDEIEVAVGRNQKFDRTGIDVMNIFHQLQGSIADLLTKLYRQGRSRSRFNDLLMTALDGAVTFKEVNDVAVFVAHDLDFDMLRIDDTFFEINFIAAESQLCFRFRPFISIAQFFHGVDHTHAAAAAAVYSFQHNRKSDFLGKIFDFFVAFYAAVTAGDVLNTGLFCLNTGINLIAEHDEVFYFRTDKDNTFFFTAFR